MCVFFSLFLFFLSLNSYPVAFYAHDMSNCTPHTGAMVGSDLYVGVGSGPVFLDNIECSGDETSLMQCNSSAATARCSSHDQDVGVSCQGRGIPYTLLNT